MSRIVAAIALVLLAAASSSAEDAVVLRGNRRIPGLRITRDDARGVAAQVVRSPDTTLDWPRHEVVRVEYGETPAEYAVALKLFERASYDRALAMFDRALERPHAPLLKQYLLFDRARCAAAAGDHAAAAEDYAALRAQGTRTRFVFDAARALVERRIASKRLAEAGRVADGISGVTKEEQEFLGALLAEAHGAFPAARRAFARVASKGGPLRADAALGEARCLLAMRRGADAERVAVSLLDADAPDDLVARAYLIIGDARKAAASDRAGIEKALFAYLRIPALYPGDERTEARALRASALCMREAYGPAGEARAQTLIAMLKRKYPGSAFAKGM